ncbi:hypothetical protein ACQR1W_29220 [Bradyrhizobium sp. HKCCYLS1011]|uniref:hypothetical protein n=1 Tax=Bradyrhizobium sp. HKCCYLS1011 TaxID=3420733 RepID=UPI003EB6B296
MSPNSKWFSFLFLFLIALGAVDAWFGRQSYVAGDTISYMDMARAIEHGKLEQAINGHWSPLYPLLIAAFIEPIGTAPSLEFATVRVLNFLVFLVTIGAFHLVLTRLWDRAQLTAKPPEAKPLLSRSQVLLAGYALLAWGCFDLTVVSRISPDLCVAAVTFAAAALYLSLEDQTASVATFALFGAVLGIGYLLKAIFFPLAFLFLLAAACACLAYRADRRLLLSAAVFLLIAAPLVGALSLKYGHLTFGESGRNTFRTDVLMMPLVHWQGGPSDHGLPEHPTRKLLDNPDVYEFAQPISATYPPWYDPTYWNKGAVLHFGTWEYGRALLRNVKRLAVLLWFAIPLGIALALLRRHLALEMSAPLPIKLLGLVAAANLLLYLVLLVEPRYLAGCLPLLGLVVLVSLRTQLTRRRPIGAALVALLITGVAIDAGPRLARTAADLVTSRGHVHADAWLVADELFRIGIHPGTPVAAIDHQDQMHWSVASISDWAFLAQVKIVSEAFPSDPLNQKEFWDVSLTRQALALDVFRRAGARIVVASGVPSTANTEGWSRIGTTDYYYKLL